MVQQWRKNTDGCERDDIIKYVSLGDGGENKYIDSWDCPRSAIKTDSIIISNLLNDNLNVKTNALNASMTIKGKGFNNIVYEVEHKKDKDTLHKYGIRVDVKSISSDGNCKENEKKLNKKYDEFVTSCLLAKRGVSPGILKMFVVTLFNKEEPIKSKTKMFEFIEPYEGNLKCLIADPISRKNSKKAIESQLTSLFTKLKNEANMYCGDIKPDNAVYRFNNTTRKLEIKLIDWDPDFCNMEANNVNEILSIISMKLLFLISSVKIFWEIENSELPFYDEMKSYLYNSDNSRNTSYYDHLIDFLLKDIRKCGPSFTSAYMLFHYYYAPKKKVINKENIGKLLDFIFLKNEEGPDDIPNVESPKKIPDSPPLITRSGAICSLEPQPNVKLFDLNTSSIITKENETRTASVTKEGKTITSDYLAPPSGPHSSLVGCRQSFGSATKKKVSKKI